LVVRHALSWFNIKYKEYANNPNSTDDDYMNVWVNEALIDALLHEEGMK
jgi:hypothetical protein